MEYIIIALAAIAAGASTVTAVKLLKKETNVRRGRLFMDTSVLIDGRIVAIAESGFLTDTISVPRSVINELQLLADTGDGDKRTKARHGLDVISSLQALSTVAVEVFPDEPRAPEGVDRRLIILAKKYQGRVCTIDFNLNKVASVEGVEVCNVNELARNLRMAYLPGEKTTLKLTGKGQDSHQGVGHLEDGTMVVVEQANSKIGSVVEVEFIRALQTAAGRMMFAKLAAQPVVKQQKPAPQQPKAPRKKQPVAAQKTKGRAPEQQPALPQKPRQQPRRRTLKNSEDRLIRLVDNQGDN